MSTSTTKTCKMCYMNIDSRARKCPYCHLWQTRLSTALNHPLAVMSFVLIPMVAIWAAMGVVWSKTFDPGRDFQPYRDQIEVTQSEIKFGQDNCGPTVVVLGTVRNQSDVTWKEVQFAAQFFDKDNRLVDAGQENKYLFVFPANDECAFTVSFRRQFPQEQYTTCKARVVSARDVRARF